eukprot:TRINITY_DN7398_c0_g3_i1.p1 TRINITY_DN7398_c0_g3~~TRINITY_DN7398_c0_g3_i1.p1  ORF type:complete len:896 (+),score=159.21 TRINITY_DN7398_c0_g3_i1:90-2777(+)
MTLNPATRIPEGPTRKITQLQEVKGGIEEFFPIVPRDIANLYKEGRICTPQGVRNSSPDCDLNLWSFVDDPNKRGCTPHRETNSAASSYTHNPYQEAQQLYGKPLFKPSTPANPAGIQNNSLSGVPDSGSFGQSELPRPGSLPIEDYSSSEQVSCAGSSHRRTPTPNIPDCYYHIQDLRSPEKVAEVVVPKDAETDSPPFEVPAFIEQEIAANNNNRPIDTKRLAHAKECLKRMKELDRQSRKQFSLDSMPDCCESTWWKFCLELAEICKKEKVSEARAWLCAVIGLAPSNAQGWCELSKLESEQQNTRLALCLIREGLTHCTGTEKCTLTIKALRHIEDYSLSTTANNNKQCLKLARYLLGDVMQTVPVDKCWKVLLEGALYEERQGNYESSKTVIDYLMNQVPRQGSIFIEAARQQERIYNYAEAFSIIKRGLLANPKFGPLAFAGIRVLEKKAWAESSQGVSQLYRTSLVTLPVHPTPGGEVSKSGKQRKRAKKSLKRQLAQLVDTPEFINHISLQSLHEFVAECRQHLCHELVWKLCYEAAQAAERTGHYEDARRWFSESFIECPANLQYKVLIGGARMELSFPHENDPKHPVAFYSLVAAYRQQEAMSRTISITRLELARFYEYNNDPDNARITLAEAKLTDWRACLEYSLMELRSGAGIETAEEIIKDSILKEEKYSSVGRLWALWIQLCNESGKENGTNIKALQKYSEAQNYVRKAGEVWCEGARIHMDPLQGELFNLDKAEAYLKNAMKYTPQYGDSFVEMMKLGLLKYGTDSPEPWLKNLYRNVATAEPNYGPLWQYCKQSALMTCQEVIHVAYEKVKLELSLFSNIYAPLLCPADSEMPSPYVDHLPPWLFVNALPSLAHLHRNLNKFPQVIRRRMIFGCEPVAP